MTVYRSPDFIPLGELGRYGEDHTDPLVRKMGRIVTDVAVAISNSSRSYDGVADWLDNIDCAISDLKTDADESDEHARDLAEELETARANIKALRYDLSKDSKARQIVFLKGEITDLNKVALEHQQYIFELERTNTQLTNSLTELQSKYDTWVAIAT